MNRRIKELLAEASLFCYDDGTVSLLGEKHVSQYDIEKFAELIIKECAVVANRAENNDKEVRCVYDVITEHFGVEQ